METAYILGEGTAPVPLRPLQIPNGQSGFETGLSRWQTGDQPSELWPAWTYIRSKLNFTIAVVFRTSKRIQTGSITKVIQLMFFVDTRLFMLSLNRKTHTNTVSLKFRFNQCYSRCIHTELSLSPQWAWQLYRKDSPSSPEHPVTAAVLRGNDKRSTLQLPLDFKRFYMSPF
jgi:hypothetical protein